MRVATSELPGVSYAESSQPLWQFQTGKSVKRPRADVQQAACKVKESAFSATGEAGVRPTSLPLLGPPEYFPEEGRRKDRMLSCEHLGGWRGREAVAPGRPAS